MPLTITINGQAKEILVPEDPRITDLVAALEMQADRVAIEQNGTIVPRAQWANVPLAAGDRIELVHFVGGGAAA